LGVGYKQEFGTMKGIFKCGGVLSVIVGYGVEAWGQCPTIDFDGLPVGTVVTTQYAGVRFSGRDPDGTSGVNPIIYNPSGGTTSEPQCLSARGDGLNEFSPEFLRLAFDIDQTAVTFNLGVRVGCNSTDTVQVRWYDAADVRVGLRNVPVNGDLVERVLVFVRIERAAGFRRIEIEAGAGGLCAERFELIDDLTFTADATPPEAVITTPAHRTCICETSANVIGTARDVDGEFGGYTLHYQRDDGSDPFHLIALNDTAVVNNVLAAWNPPNVQDDYILKLTSYNGCGVSTEDRNRVFVDTQFDSLVVRQPTNGLIAGGSVCFDGTVWDSCSGTFTVDYQPAAGGAFLPVNSVSPPWVTFDPFASWNTAVGAAAVPDGDYRVRIRGTDFCNHTATVTRDVTIDNAWPTAVITTPTNCGCVNGLVDIVGTATDAHLAGWSLWYTGGDEHGWVPIPDAHGNAPVVHGLLGTWDTRGLRPCCYTIRLLVTDRSVVDCDDVHQSEYFVSLDVGQCDAGAFDFDVDNDGDVDLFDYAAFEHAFTGP